MFYFDDFAQIGTQLIKATGKSVQCVLTIKPHFYKLFFS